MTTINNLSGLDKAGLLFQMLGESLALTHLKSFQEAEVKVWQKYYLRWMQMKRNNI